LHFFEIYFLGIPVLGMRVWGILWVRLESKARGEKATAIIPSLRPSGFTPALWESGAPATGFLTARLKAFPLSKTRFAA
jgi:hypothetical protein